MELVFVGGEAVFLNLNCHGMDLVSVILKAVTMWSDSLAGASKCCDGGDVIFGVSQQCH